MNNFEVNAGQLAFPEGYEISDKEFCVGGICRNTVLGKSPFRDQEMKIQLVSSCKMWGEGCNIYGASFGIIGYLLPCGLPKSLRSVRLLGTEPVTSVFLSG